MSCAKSRGQTVKTPGRATTFQRKSGSCAPGHLPRGTAGTELITFSPTVELEKVNAVLAKNRARLGAPEQPDINLTST